MGAVSPLHPSQLLVLCGSGAPGRDGAALSELTQRGEAVTGAWQGPA